MKDYFDGNADYDAARDKQAQIEQRIKEIEYMLQKSVMTIAFRGYLETNIELEKSLVKLLR